MRTGTNSESLYIKDRSAWDLSEFLSSGGEIKQVPYGFSSEVNLGFNNVNVKPNAQAKMREIMSNAISEAHAKRNNPNVLARNEAREKGLKHFNGSACVTCGSTLKYTSTNSCFQCNKASSLKNHKKRMVTP